MSMSAEADTINSAMADPAPEMPKPVNGEIELLRGLRQTKDGKDEWHTRAVVRELTGADEEFLATKESNTDIMYIEYMNALLQRAVESIGDIDVQAHPQVLNKLIMADRDMLFLATVRATYGTTRKIRTTCAACGTKNDVELDLYDDFPVRKPDSDLREPIEVETSKGVVYLRLPNGEDTLEAQKLAKANDASLNTFMLARCSVWKNAPEDFDPIEWARNLNIGDRKNLVRSLLDIEAGPKMGEVDTHCAECGELLPILLDWVSLLLG